jgi:dolichol kinase
MKKWQRNLYHLGVGILFPLGYYFGHKPGATIFISFLFMLILIFEFERFKHPGFNRWVFEHLGSLVKSKEKFRPIGTTYFLFGVLITVVLFPHYIAVASLTFLAIGDVAAAVVGERYGRIKLLNKSLEGTITFFITAFLAGLVLMQLPRMQIEGLNFQLVIWGALTATLVEFFSFEIDDNLTVPIITSLVMKIISG